MIRLHARPTPLPSANGLSLPVFLFVTGPAYGRERGGGGMHGAEHTTARNLVPIEIVQSSLSSSFTYWNVYVQSNSTVFLYLSHIFGLLNELE
jgi:hypothetical protein